MIVIGLLVKGPQGEEYLVTGESESGAGPAPVRRRSGSFAASRKDGF